MPLRSTEIEGKDAELSPGSSGNEVLASPKWFRDTDELNKELDAIKLDFTNKINTVREKYLINGLDCLKVVSVLKFLSACQSCSESQKVDHQDVQL